MKIIFVVMLIASQLLFLIIVLDFLLGFTFPQELHKLVNPFQVMEPSEYFVFILFACAFAMKIIKFFIQKFKEKHTS